jgi:uncharacterized NAD(P)/FAD-binding protein YdhS
MMNIGSYTFLGFRLLCRTVVDGLRPHTQALWKALPRREQEQFLKRLRPYWEIHRHRMAWKVAKRFAEL